MSSSKQPVRKGRANSPRQFVTAQSRSGIIAGISLIVAAIILIYWPAMQGRFIMDDDLLLTENPLIKAPDGLYRIWFTREPVDYWPVANTTLWLEWHLWGMNPTGYHSTNLLLHMANCLLIWRLLHRLAIPGAFWAALLYAVHPVNVESVAWIAQRKNGLSLLFSLLSVLWYLKAQKPVAASTENTSLTAQEYRPSWNRWYWFSFLAFTLGMLSKGSVAVLPVLLLLIVLWQRGRITRADFLPTLPFFFIAVIFTGVNIWFQSHGSPEMAPSATFGQRLLGAGAAIWFYLFKALCPVNLMFIYPQWNIQMGNLWWWLPLALALLVTGLLIWKRSTRWGRPLLFAWFFFCVALAPVMGFTDISYMKYSLVADHYQYLSILAVLIVVGAGLTIAFSKLAPPARWIGDVIFLLLLSTLMFFAWNQAYLYADAMTLYQTTIDRNPDCWLAYNNLGNCFTAKRMPQKALECYQTALRLNPSYFEARNNLALTLVGLGRTSEGIEQYQQALTLKPDNAECRNNLGNAYQQAGQPEEAIAQFQQALRLKPENADAYYNLGLSLADQGHLPEAISKYEEALKLNPDYSKAHNNLANILADQGHYPEAIEHYQKALESAPDHLEARFNMAITLAQMGRFEEALQAAEKSLEIARFQGRTDMIQRIEASLRNLRSQMLPQSNSSSSTGSSE